MQAADGLVRAPSVRERVKCAPIRVERVRAVAADVPTLAEDVPV